MKMNEEWLKMPILPKKEKYLIKRKKKKNGW